MNAWLMGGGLMGLAVLATWFDLRERRIPNFLTVAAVLVALGSRVSLGSHALVDGLLAATLCFLVALPFFLAGGLGGGDVKLLTACGAFLGLERVAALWLATALLGGVMAGVQMVRRGAVRRTLWNLYHIVRGLGPGTFTGWRGADSRAFITLATPGAVTVPYGVAISAGALAAWLL